MDTNALTLDDLGLKFGTDKASNHHDYLKIYDQYLSPLRNEPIALLELGYSTGASAYMWEAYFPNARLDFVDINGDNGFPPPPRCVVTKGDQADPALVPWFDTARYDIVIDDASHQSSKTIQSFRLWWSYLKPGGLYVVEDVHASYQVDFYGEEEARLDPELPCGSGRTTMQFFKRLTDELNKVTVSVQRIPPEYQLGYDLEWIHFYTDLVIVKKAAK